MTPRHAAAQEAADADRNRAIDLPERKGPRYEDQSRIKRKSCPARQREDSIGRVIALVVVTSAAIVVQGSPVTAGAMCQEVRATVVGTEGPDRLLGTDQGDVVQAFGAKDYVETYHGVTSSAAARESTPRSSSPKVGRTASTVQAARTASTPASAMIQRCMGTRETTPSPPGRDRRCLRRPRQRLPDRRVRS
jgi:hypothetical protein